MTGQPRFSIIPGWIVTDPRLKGRDLQVLCLLGRHTDKQGWCRRSQVKMAGQLNCARSTVQASLDRLADIGVVEKHLDESLPDGRDSAHFYRVIFDREPPSGYAFDAWQDDEQEENIPVFDATDTDPPADISAPPADTGAAPPADSGSAPINAPYLTIPFERIEREARDREGKKEAANLHGVATDRKAIEKQFWRVIKDWPGFAGMPKQGAMRAFFALTDEQRDRAERKRDPWFALLKAQKKSHVPAPSTYFGELLFDEVPDPDLPPPVKLTGPAFGPIWGANRMLRLLDGHDRLGPPDVTRESRIATFAGMVEMLGREKAEARYRAMGHDIGAAGELLFPDDFEQRQWADHVERNGWPAVNRMHRAAESGNGISGAEAERGAAFADLMEPVPVGSARWDEWRAFHKAHCWPWVPDPGKQRVVYFPAGEPEFAIEAFKRRIEGHVDAAAE